MGIIYLAILLCSIGFAIATIYLAFILKRITAITKSLGKTLKEVEQQLHYITPQLNVSLKETAKLVDDTGEKLKATDSIFDSIDNVGTSVNTVSALFRKNADKLDEEQFQRIAEGIKWSEVVFQVLSKWKKQPTRNNELMIRPNTEIVPVNTGKEG